MFAGDDIRSDVVSMSTSVEAYELFDRLLRILSQEAIKDLPSQLFLSDHAACSPIGPITKTRPAATTGDANSVA